MQKPNSHAIINTYKKKEIQPILQYLKYIQPLKSLIENGTGAKSFSSDANIQKIDNFVKLFYKLFLYSVIGIFAKLISRIFKL